MQSNLVTFAAIFVLMFASTQAFQLTANSVNDIRFTHDIFKIIEGIADITFEGKLNTEDNESNKLGAFLNIAGKTFPIIESMGLTEQKLEFTEKWCYDYGFVTGCSGFTFEFFIGWYVTNGTAVDYESLNVTYVPYVRGEGEVFVDADTWAYQFDSDFSSRFVNIHAPISTQLNFNKDVEFCYDGNAIITDPGILVTFETKVKSCQADMADNVMHPTDFDYSCDFGSPIVIPILNYTDTAKTYYNIISRTCLTLHKN
jgi:hypothetical protein